MAHRCSQARHTPGARGVFDLSGDLKNIVRELPSRVMESEGQRREQAKAEDTCARKKRQRHAGQEAEEYTRVTAPRLEGGMFNCEIQITCLLAKSVAVVGSEEAQPLANASTELQLHNKLFVEQRRQQAN